MAQYYSVLLTSGFLIDLAHCASLCERQQIGKRHHEGKHGQNDELKRKQKVGYHRGEEKGDDALTKRQKVGNFHRKEGD